jgi:2-hydroxy-4-carboxymuconate semialdehyde hemiacetal dehydrogenase
VNIALLGYGSIARAHVEALKGEGVTFRTVMGRLPDATAAFAAEHGFARHTTDLDDALADPDLDAVIVASPTDVHARQTEQALLAGKHVLVEIPLATSLADVDALDRLARRVDRRLMVCHTQRYYPPLVEARRRIATGELRVYHVSCRYGFLRRENVNWQGRRRSWTDNLIWHHGCHAVDTCLWLLGADAVEVSCQIARPSNELGIPMDFDVLMHTPDDRLVAVSMSYNTKLAYNEYLLIGEETTLLATNHRLSSPEGVIVDAGASAGPEGNPIRLQDREFLAAIRERRAPAIDPRSVRPAMRVLQAVQDAYDARS